MINPHKDIYTRLGQSKIAGVGVFAIVDIPKGTHVFANDTSEIIRFNESDLQLKKIDKPLQDLYNDFCVVKTENNIKKYGCPTNFNNLTVSRYVNHSDIPNMACGNNYSFYALRDIKPGEELTLDYKTYSEDGDNF